MAENYRTIRAIIDLVREEIKDTTQSPRYTDELIYVKLLKKRSVLLNQEVNKRKHKSKFIFKTFCMPLTLSSDIPCDCVPPNLGCKVLKSVFKLPTPITSKSGMMLRIFSVNGDTEFTYKEMNVGKYNKYSRRGSAPAFYSIVNDYLYIVGYPENKLRGVMVEMIPEDPLQLNDINLCVGRCHEDNIDTSQTCFDITEDTFNIEGHLEDTLIQMVKEDIIGRELPLPEDITANTNTTPQQTSI